MQNNDDPDLHTLLDDLDSRLARGETLDPEILAQQYPAYAEDIRAHLLSASLTLLPTIPTRPPAPAAEVERARNASWQRFLQVTSSEPLPRVSLWTRLVQAIPQVLEDLASFSVVRGNRQVYRRVSALARGMTKGDEPVQEIKADPIVLEPLKSGDKLMIDFIMPRPGAPAVVLREGEHVQLLYPLRPEQARRLESGAQLQFAGMIQGRVGDEQELAFVVVPEQVAQSLIGAPEETLVDTLVQQSTGAIRRYRYVIEA